mgnify:CR=1 FL=1
MLGRLLIDLGSIFVWFFVANLGIQSAASGDSRHRAWPGLGNKMGPYICCQGPSALGQTPCRHELFQETPWTEFAMMHPILLPSSGQARWRESPLAALWILVYSLRKRCRLYKWIFSRLKKWISKWILFGCTSCFHYLECPQEMTPRCIGISSFGILNGFGSFGYSHYAHVRAPLCPEIDTVPAAGLFALGLG